jgi:cytochrome P450
MTQDPDVYAEPHIFRPERFLVGECTDPREAVFGFGRRWEILQLHMH